MRKPHRNFEIKKMKIHYFLTIYEPRKNTIFLKFRNSGRDVTLKLHPLFKNNKLIFFSVGIYLIRKMSEIPVKRNFVHDIYINLNKITTFT